MSLVIKEFVCHGHGRFDATEPVCPHGCTLVERVFHTPVGVATRRTHNIDATLDMIAKDHKLSDINTRRDAHSARVTDPKTRKAMEQQEAVREHLHRKYAGLSLVDTKSGTGGWGGVTPGGVLEVGRGVRNEGGGVPATGGIGGDSVLAEVKDTLVKPATRAIRDPQGLTVKDAKIA